MISTWTEMQENVQLSESVVIQEGLDKLAVYRDRTNLVPAYAIAMSKFVFQNFIISLVRDIEFTHSA
jgi:hypothetical protein